MYHATTETQLGEARALTPAESVTRWLESFVSRRIRPPTKNLRELLARDGAL